MRRTGLETLWLLQGNLLDHGDAKRIVDNEQNASDQQDCARKLAAVIKLCSNAGIAKTVATGQYFTTLDDAELDKLGGSCREYTLPRDNALSNVKGWTRMTVYVVPLKWTRNHFLLHHHPAMSLVVVVQTRLILLEDLPAPFLVPGCPVSRWMFSEPDLLQIV